VFAAGFLALYLGSAFVVPNLASAAMPLPNAPAGQMRTWITHSTSAAVLLGACQLLSASCFGVFAVMLRRTASTAAQVAVARKATPWGLAAVAGMALSSVLSWVLVAAAPSASTGTVAALRTASFIAGGTAHVVALGVFVLLAARIPGFGKAVRVFAVIAAIPAITSLVSLVWFQGAVFILLGRLLCMAWVICAAISTTRRVACGAADHSPPPPGRPHPARLRAGAAERGRGAGPAAGRASARRPPLGRPR
jgi:hypothetical protein